MSNKGTALVLGASAGAGFAIARALIRKGWQVRALGPRPVEGRRLLPEVDWVEGDPMNADDIKAAAMNTALIVHAIIPSSYLNWRGRTLIMLDNTIAAARASGARIMFPGTTFNYGPDVFQEMTGPELQTPRAKSSRIRVEMEDRLRAAACAGTHVLIVRAGTFFDPCTNCTWLAEGVVKTGQPVRSATESAPPEAGRVWVYLPDYAEAVAQIVEQDHEPASFEVLNFGMQ